VGVISSTPLNMNHICNLLWKNWFTRIYRCTFLLP